MSESETTNSNSVVDKLIKLGLVSNTLGEVKTGDKTGMVLWAHMPPGPGFEISLAVCDLISKERPTILVDDVLPQGYFKRSDMEQKEVTDAYLEFFSKRGCKVVTTSDLYKGKFGNSFMHAFLEFSERISVNVFLHLLPKGKKTILGDQSMAEVVHTSSHLFALDQASLNLGLETILIPSFNQAAFLLHRQISKKPMSAVVTPKFGTEADIKKALGLIKSL